MTTEHRENRSLPIRTAVEPASLLPLSAHMSYGQMRMALYTVAPDLHVASARLPGKLDGIYCLATNTVLIDRRITYTRKRCTLVHELVHWAHDDDTSKGCEGSRIERRCRRRTALLLIDPAEYALAERMYGGNPTKWPASSTSPSKLSKTTDKSSAR